MFFINGVSDADAGNSVFLRAQYLCHFGIPDKFNLLVTKRFLLHNL